METGLLESLRKYRPRENHDPLENFITEAFSWILNNHSDFSDFFLGDISKKLNIQFQTKGCEWETQCNFDGVYPDMVCRSDNNAIIFEHKTWSKLHENQLQNYKDYATKNFVISKIVLITADYYQHKQNPDLALCWHDIYTLITNWLNKNNKDAPFIFEDFLKLLKSEGMGPSAPISHESIMYYYASNTLETNIYNLLKRVEKEDWTLNISQGNKKFVINVIDENYGRSGINLLNSWNPGIFVGILLEGEDHCTKPMNLAKGPDFCLILSFDDYNHADYPLNSDYNNLVENLSKKVENLNDGWQLYNHLDDSTITEKNKYHPIHIRKPMLDVFAGTSTIGDQAKAFYETANKLIKIVTSENYFWKLREDYK